ncbi:MAG: hypothetical protein IJ928_03105 [Prevotella sp.]|nr:hypothetical protein [Prevotella sp.]
MTITRYLFSSLLLVPMFALASPHDDDIKRRCLVSLAAFMDHAYSLYTDAGRASTGDTIGYFRAKQSGYSTEDGVRTNADLCMVAAFVYEKGRTEDIHLPAGLTFPRLRNIAIRSLRYACGTHRANKLIKCSDGKYWGSEPGHHQWESSLWALSVALAADFIDQGWGLTRRDREQVEKLLAAEADFQLSREVPTAWQGDTKAEENGWESNVLASAVAFCPNHPNADKWREAMNTYGFNCYTVAADAKSRQTVEGKKAAQWFKGANLFDDFTLQNHNYFHTSYQNAVMQEQAETIVALNLLGETGQPVVPQTLTWHWREVWDGVLSQLALCDGELAMPNGNDWSMFLYDQLPAYSAMATIGRNADAMMLESRCLDQLLRRQQTTPDGAYMLNADIGPRRMGVTAHRVLVAYLLHDLFSTGNLKASSWESFQRRHATARTFHSQNVVRSLTRERFAALSWSQGLKNLSAVIVPNKVENSKIAIPFKSGFGGNLVGVPKAMAARPTFVADSTEWLAYAQGNNAYCVWATTGNAVIVIGDAKAEEQGLLAVSVDPFTKEKRTIYVPGGRHFESDGKQAMRFNAKWANIDDAVGIVVPERSQFRFGGRQLVNSIWTARLTTGSNINIYFSNITAQQTAAVAAETLTWEQDGWTAITTCDPDGQEYLLAFNPGTAKKNFKVPRKLKKKKKLKKWIIDYGTK